MINAILRAHILQSYNQAQVIPNTHEFETWLSATATKYKLAPGTVRSVLASQANALLAQVNSNNCSEAQQIAQLSGATTAKALMVIAEAMEASRRRLIRDRQGNPLKDAEGKHVYEEDPLWAERLRAAELAAKINGAFAPTQVDINHTITLERRSDAELEKRFNELVGTINRIATERRLLPASDNGTGTDQRRDAGEKSPGGPVLLADYCDSDQG